ncbi:MAG: PilW family protein [Puniceicoccales bacterium]
MTARSKAGFSLLEAIVAMTLSSLVIGVLVALFLPLVERFRPEPKIFDDLVYQRAPAASALASAVELHDMFNEMLSAAAGVYVFGGVGFDPVSGSPGVPLAWDFATDSLPAVHASDLLSSYTAANAWSPVLSFASNPAPGDFTVVLMRDASSLLAIAQVRRFVDDSKACYRVQLRCGPGLANALEYRFYRPIEADQWAMPPGATHRWIRWDPAWRRVEPGPTTMVFPDPALTGMPATGAAAPVSRFIYSAPAVRQF